MYHKLLIGAVNSGINIEKFLKNNGIDVDLGEQIKIASPLKKLFGDDIEMHSNQKLDFFYITVPCVCANGLLTYLKFGLLYTIFTVIVLSIWGMYALAKGYYVENEQVKYKWIYYVVFLLGNTGILSIILNIK